MTGMNMEQITDHHGTSAMAGMRIARAIGAAERDSTACFELGVAFSAGSHGVECDLIEAHMWFNLAAARGHEDAADYRAEIAGDLNAREIAEAQRRARQWLAASHRRAA